jgi:hypothetical protein
LDVSDAKRFKAFEDENTKKVGRYWTAGQRYAQGDQLKKIVPPSARRGAVAHLEEAFEVSEWRTCSVLRVDRTSMRYRSRRPSDAAWLRLSPSTLLLFLALEDRRVSDAQLKFQYSRI